MPKNPYEAAETAALYRPPTPVEAAKARVVLRVDRLLGDVSRISRIVTREYQLATPDWETVLSELEDGFTDLERQVREFLKQRAEVGDG